MPDEFLHMDRVDVDVRAHQATEHDEGQVLTELYGEPDADGIFRGEER